MFCGILLLPWWNSWILSMTVHCDICVYIHDRSCSHCGHSSLHDFLLDFLKRRNMEKRARSLYPNSCCAFCKLVFSCSHRLASTRPSCGSGPLNSWESLWVKINKLYILFYFKSLKNVKFDDAISIHGFTIRKSKGIYGHCLLVWIPENIS